MPQKSSKARGPKTNRRRRAPKKGNRRAPPVNNHFFSIVVTSIQLKQSHKKEEIYPISLDKLISRDNIGQDADIRLVGYSMSVALATGNDCSTVSMNIGHEGPWIRRSDDPDTFNQVCTEHTIRGKSILFKKKLLATTEREYINPDSNTNGVNTIDLRVRDPCGVIPGVAARIEFRAHIIRRVPSTTFANADQPATDRYEDQDVNSGSNPVPSPPTGIKHAPSQITYNSGGHPTRFHTDGTPSNGKLKYTASTGIHFFTVEVTNPPQAVSGTYQTDVPVSQAFFEAAGYDGQLAYV